MKKTNIVSRTLLAIVIGAAAFGAQATERPGFYAGVGVGQSIVDEGILDDEDTAFSIFGGYQVNRYFGVEAGYADFGKIEPRGLPGKVEADSAYLTAVGTLPFTENFSGYAKAGFHAWDAKARIPGVANAKDDGTDPTYGLGLQYRFTDNVALRGEYSRFEMDDIDVDLAQVQLRFDF
ncbi:MAG TPA: outer membrane beta-barrel protein [Lysobacter sp.]|jgi:OOP family OmpA-OmpF porin|nr:outer membrane beta-barrel protein [Lysobacter sp.]